MTRTDVMASSRPRTVGAAPIGKGSPGISRRLALLPVLLALGLALPGAAIAAEPTANYEQKAKPPTPPTPSTGTSPSKESSKPTTTPTSKGVAPAKASTTPTAKEAKASTLPFTGFDLRWSLGIGLLLIGAGFSIVVVQRRQARRD